MRILILEDDLKRQEMFMKKFDGHVWAITDFPRIVINNLKKMEFDELYLDHDLNGESFVPSGWDTGYAVAEWLSRNMDRCPPKVYIHSLNEQGAANIKKILPCAILKPYAWLSDETIKAINGGIGVENNKNSENEKC